MTPTERAKRSDALYYETVSVTRRVLCDMIANREADLEDARAENEELWASNERMGLKYMAAMGELGEENEQLKAENAKLRELCADLYAEMITYSKAPNYNASVWAPKLRELGAEEDA